MSTGCQKVSQTGRKIYIAPDARSVKIHHFHNTQYTQHSQHIHHTAHDKAPLRWRSQNASYLTEVNMHSSVTRQYKNGKWRQVQWLNNTFIFTHYMFLVLKFRRHSNKLWPCCSLSTSKTLYLFQKVSNFEWVASTTSSDWKNNPLPVLAITWGTWEMMMWA